MFNLVNRARKKNNKGFSLVELIVVVLIIAIIAVALAPQVMKYVSSSRTNVDQNNAASIKSSVQAAVTEFLGEGGTITAGTDVSPTSGALATNAFGTSTIGPSGNTKTLAQLINDNVGSFPAIKTDNTASWYVTIDATGKVTVTAGTSTNKSSVASA